MTKRKRPADCIDTFRASYVALYHEATPEDVAYGRDWYAAARRQVAEWAVLAERPVANIAALVAVLSPQCPWPANLAIAEELLMHGEARTHGALPVNVDKALRVLHENLTDTRVVMPTGNKVANFAANLAGDDSAVTVDSHMTQAAWNDPTVEAFPRRNEYDAYALAVRLAADETGEAPACLQAIVWVVWKRLHVSGRKRHVRKLNNIRQAALAKRRAAYARRKSTAAIAA